MFPVPGGDDRSLGDLIPALQHLDGNGMHPHAQPLLELFAAFVNFLQRYHVVPFLFSFFTLDSGNNDSSPPKNFRGSNSPALGPG